MAVSRPNINAAKGLAFPIAASVFAGAATMFMPTAMLESITGATGLSEIFPATAAPLGDTARALIAFSTGALTMAITAILSNRKGPKNMAAHQFKPVFTDPVEEAAPSMVAKLKERLTGIGKKGLTLPNMPWRKNADSAAGIRELGDLPKLRNADSHPDAAPRRPFSAELDLGSVATEVEAPAPTPTARFWNDEVQSAAIPMVADVKPEPAPLPAPLPASVPASVQEPVMAAFHSDPLPEMVPEMVPVASPVSAVAVDTLVAAPTTATATDPTHIPSLADLVAQLELAVQQRQSILDRIAATQSQILAAQSAPVAEPVTVAPVIAETVSVAPAAVAVQTASGMPHNDGYVPPYFDRPPLEAVPMEAKADDDHGEEDEALRAALATLRRMNGQAG